VIINSSGKEKWLPFDDQGDAHTDDQKQQPGNGAYLS
jgi:hypothetical protein